MLCQAMYECECLESLVQVVHGLVPPTVDSIDDDASMGTGTGSRFGSSASSNKSDAGAAAKGIYTWEWEGKEGPDSILCLQDVHCSYPLHMKLNENSGIRPH
jgi:hypothetical protein